MPCLSCLLRSNRVGNVENESKIRNSIKKTLLDRYYPELRNFKVEAGSFLAAVSPCYADWFPVIYTFVLRCFEDLDQR